MLKGLFYVCQTYFALLLRSDFFFFFSHFVSVFFYSVICPPTSVTGVTSCGNNDIAVSWNPSTGSGVNYVVHAHKEGGTSANFSTTQTSHALTGLQCGMLYSLTVAARDSECTSVLGVPILTETGSHLLSLGF